MPPNAEPPSILPVACAFRQKFEHRFQKWLNSPIKITIGMGTPNSKSNIDRILTSYFLILRSALPLVVRRHVVTLSAPNSRGVACTERPDQQREKGPVQ